MYEIFARLLQEKGITPYRVSKETGVSQGSLSDWKNGKSKPKYEKMIKIADFLGVSVEYLTTGQEPRSNDVTEEPTIEKLSGTYLRLARRAQELGLDDEDVDAILAIYEKHKKRNE